MLHQVVDVLLVHCGIVLVDEELELGIIHELIWIKFVHLEERLVVVAHQLRVAVVSVFFFLLDALLFLNSLPLLFLVQLLSL